MTGAVPGATPVLGDLIAGSAARATLMCRAAAAFRERDRSTAVATEDRRGFDLMATTDGHRSAGSPGSPGSRAASKACRPDVRCLAGRGLARFEEGPSHRRTEHTVLSDLVMELAAVGFDTGRR